MDFLESVREYINETYPLYRDYSIEVLANEYDITEGLDRIVEEVETFCESAECYLPELYDLPSFSSELEESITRVEPPEGFIFVTVVKDGHRVGLNIPREL